MIPERDLTRGKPLGGSIRRLAQDPGKIEEMQRNAASLGNARAAADIVDECRWRCLAAGRVTGDRCIGDQCKEMQKRNLRRD